MARSSTNSILLHASGLQEGTALDVPTDLRADTLRLLAASLIRIVLQFAGFLNSDPSGM